MKKNKIKSINEVFLSELNTENAHESFKCSRGLITTMRSKINKYGEYPTVKTMTDYLAVAGYELTCDWNIVKTN